MPSAATSGPISVTTAGGTATSSGSFTVTTAAPPPPPTTTTTTAYYGLVALSVNGTLSYTLSDPLGSVSASVNTSGAVTAAQLYSPYGAVRFQSGVLPTDYGFTHQRSDASTSGLDYYGARYYDPVAGQFTSGDITLTGGFNRYAYVVGKPETFVDPDGAAPRKPIREWGVEDWKKAIGGFVAGSLIGLSAVLGPIAAAKGHNVGPDSGRANNGSDEVIETMEPTWVPGIAGAGPDPLPKAQIPEGGPSEPPYYFDPPIGSPEPVPSQAPPSYPTFRPGDTLYHPSPSDRNRPNDWRVPGQFSTPQISWGELFREHVNVISSRIATLHAVHGAWSFNPMTQNLPAYHTGAHGFGQAFTSFAVVATLAIGMYAVATSGVGGNEFRSTVAVY